jgi:Ferritin-like domain
MAARTTVDVLEELLATEARLIAMYEAGLRRGVLDPALARPMLDQEHAHARGLRQTLARGGARNPRASVPAPELTAALRSREAFARYALDMETEATASYVDAAATIRDAGLRRALGSILTCEAAHAVAWRNSLGERLLVD